MKYVFAAKALVQSFHESFMWLIMLPLESDRSSFEIINTSD